MTTAHLENVATIVPPPFNPHTKASTMLRVDHCGVPMQLMCVGFAKWDYKIEDSNLKNSSLLSI